MYLKLILSISLVISISMVGIWLFTFRDVNPNNYGIKFDYITNNVEEEHIYEPGKYFVPFSTFIQFPSTLQTLEFTDEHTADSDMLHSRTSDGLDVNLQISFQYQIIKDELFELFHSFDVDYEDVFIRIASDSLKDVASDFTAISFLNNRTIIGNNMADILNNSLVPAYANVRFFQLRVVDLPDAFEQAIQEAEVARQNVQTASFHQQEAIIRAQTQILEAQAKANITLLEANASAQAFIIQTEAQAEAVNISLTAERIAYYALAQELGFNSTELLSYLWIMAIMEHDSSYLIIGTETPIILSP
jgi:regulator of protease activity HflC (stomatin/prohibitin superfamily)